MKQDERFVTIVPTNQNIRLLQDVPLDGPTNMARDEMLLNRVGAGQSAATLRLYQWKPPTISLGYFQRYADYAALDAPAGELAVVRRLTGGGAILHDLELTYSLALPNSHSLLSDGPTRLYELAHDAVVASLAMLDVPSARCGTTDDSTPTRGPFFCFERRHALDVLIGSDKVAGSAQRRTRSAILQHGSIVLKNRYEQQPTAQIGLPIQDSVPRLRSEFIHQFVNVTGESLKPGAWTPSELAAVAGLIPKYAGVAFVRRM